MEAVMEDKGKTRSARPDRARSQRTINWEEITFSGAPLEDRSPSSEEKPEESELQAVTFKKGDFVTQSADMVELSAEDNTPVQFSHRQELRSELARQADPEEVSLVQNVVQAAEYGTDAPLSEAAQDAEDWMDDNEAAAMDGTVEWTGSEGSEDESVEVRSVSPAQTESLSVPAQDLNSSVSEETDASGDTVLPGDESADLSGAAPEEDWLDDDEEDSDFSYEPGKTGFLHLDEDEESEPGEAAEPVSGTEQVQEEAAASAPDPDSSGSVSPEKPSSRSKSARPKQISYVDMSSHDDYVVPLNKTRKKVSKAKILGFAAGLALVAAGSAYASFSYYYSDHFFPRTSIDGIACGGLTAYEVEQKIADQYKDYKIQVASRGNDPQTISGSTIRYQYLSSGEVLKLLKQQKPWLWLFESIAGKDYTTQQNITFDKGLLRTQLKALSCAMEENQISPQNAYITLSNDQFTIVPETEGQELKVREAYRLLDEAVASGKTSVDFESDPEAYAEAELKQDSPELHAMLDAYNNYATAKITYTFGDKTETLDGDTLKNWLEFDEKGQLLQGDGSFHQHVLDYVAQLAAVHDTVGTTRTFLSTSGRFVYVYGYAYGWQIDQEAEAARLEQEIMAGSQVTREPVYSMTANAYGDNDIGDTYIEVDMGEQHMYYYKNGYNIFESDFVSGDITVGDHATPEGIYQLYFKESPAILKGQPDENGKPEYETEVTYWMPFNGGIGFHDAEWQPYFGGDRFIGGGSHGCINLPYDAAATLFSIIDYGIPIICFY